MLLGFYHGWDGILAEQGRKTNFFYMKRFVLHLTTIRLLLLLTMTIEISPKRKQKNSFSGKGYQYAEASEEAADILINRLC